MRFQERNIHEVVYTLSREIALLCFLFVETKILLQGEYIRSLLTLFLFLLFLITSKTYEQKRKIITVGYLFIFVILFLVYSICSAYYSSRTVTELKGSHGFWPDDYFILYFFTVALCYLIILIYLKFLKRNNSIVIHCFDFDKNHVVYSIVVSCLLLLLYKFGHYEDAIIPVFSFIISGLLLSRKYRLVFIFMFLISLLSVGIIVLETRYLIVQICFPILIFIAYSRSNRISLFKANVWMLFGFIAVMIYGVVSEVIKLNVFWGGNYQIMDRFLSLNVFNNSVLNQIYRLFGIWIKLGGYIIFHVREVNHGYYYGLTFIKSLAKIFGFPYINLPIISAYYNGSTYAQPGLLAEGFANFGIFGSIGNIFTAFVFCELTCNQYIKKKSFSFLFISIVPFTKILFDGGSINSAIVILILSVVLIAPNFFSKEHRNEVEYDF